MVSSNLVFNPFKYYYLIDKKHRLISFDGGIFPFLTPSTRCSIKLIADIQWTSSQKRHTINWRLSQNVSFAKKKKERKQQQKSGFHHQWSIHRHFLIQKIVNQLNLRDNKSILLWKWVTTTTIDKYKNLTKKKSTKQKIYKKKTHICKFTHQRIYIRDKCSSKQFIHIQIIYIYKL